MPKERITIDIADDGACKMVAAGLCGATVSSR